MRGKIKLLSVTTAVAVAVACTAGGIALADVVTGNPSSGSLTTAGFELSAKAEGVKVYSAVATNETGEGVFYDVNNVAYKHEQSLVQGSEGTINFAHGGGVTLDTKGVNIENMIPGDKVEFDIAVTSESNISFNYRAELYVDKTKGADLINELDFTAGDLGLYRTDLGEFEPVEGGDYAPAVITDYTPWTALSANQTSVERVHVSVSLPIDADKGQGESVRFEYVARGIQNIEAQPDVATVVTAEGERGFKTLEDAVTYATEHDVQDVSIINSTVLEEGAVIIDRGINFKGVADAEGQYPTLKGVRISIVNGAAASFENVKFEGVSYIDVSDGMELVLNGCTADVSPVRFFDEGTRTYLPDAAFIVSGTSRTAALLTLTQNNFACKTSAAICMRSPLRDGTLLSGNTFGSAEAPYGGNSVIGLGGAQNGAVVTVRNNHINGSLPLSLGNGTSELRFTVLSEGNVAHGVKNGVFVSGTAAAAFLDSNSKIDENALTCANLDVSGLLLGAVDVSLGALNKITAGKVSLSNVTEAEFYTGYVYAGTLAHNAVALYQDGNLYAYLNSTEEEPHYVVTRI